MRRLPRGQRTRRALPPPPYHLFSLESGAACGCGSGPTPRTPRSIRSPRCGRPPTGTNARCTTCSACASRNHPDMSRILMPFDWEGHPLRRDYPIGGEDVGSPRPCRCPPTTSTSSPPKRARPARRPSAKVAARRDRTGRRRRRGRDTHRSARTHPRRRGARRGGRGRARPHDHQPGTAASVHPRGPASGHRTRRRGRPGHPPGDRLPAHRHREAVREQDLLAGHHAGDADGLPLAVLQHARLHDGRREAAAARGAGARQVAAGDDRRAEPDHEPPGLARHQRARARGHVGPLLHLPGA